MDILNEFVAETATTETYEIQTTILCRFLSCNNIRRNILREAATTLNHHVACDMAELVNEYIGTYDSIIVNHYFACKFCCITDDAATAQLTVVSHVYTFHQEVIAAHNGLALRGSATRDGYVLTDTIVVAHLADGFLATEFEILWLGRDAGTWEKFITIADACTYMYCYTILKYIIIS